MINDADDPINYVPDEILKELQRKARNIHEEDLDMMLLSEGS